METEDSVWGRKMILFLLEEPSMEALLEEILPQILDEDFRLISHEGKGDLIKSLPIKLKAWNIPNTKFVVVHDQDNNDCKVLKKSIRDVCNQYNREVVIRIVCRELEAWYFGDLVAVEKAFNKDLSKLKNSKKYNDPDAISDPKAILKKYIPELTQIDGAKRISKHMDIKENKSHSFNVFVEGVKKLENSVG